MMGWFGAALLTLAGYGWGLRLSAHRSPTPLPAALLLTLAASATGLALVIQAFLNGQDAPLPTGAVGALAAAAFAVFTARQE